MRFVSYIPVDGPPTFGLVTEDGEGAIDLAGRLDGVTDLDQLIRDGRLGDAEPFRQDSPDHRLDSVTYPRLLDRPGKILCIGVNYGGRAAEYEDPSDAAYPSVFPRFADTFTGHLQPLCRPPESPQLDYEGEIVAVIGTAGRRIPRDRALDHLAGLTLGNEGTIRDWVRHAKFNVTQGKNWAQSGAFGPHLVTMDEIGVDFESLQLTTTVNGEQRQHDTPATMKYPLDYQISYLSTFTELRPGDVIFTGTPTGAGARFDPPIWLKPGDVVEVTVPQIGTLRNPVADEFPDGRTIDPPPPV
ncbi:MAG: fumarylacetoacetate hydrolase family protein [Actinomycetota bacterium]